MVDFFPIILMHVINARITRHSTQREKKEIKSTEKKLKSHSKLTEMPKRWLVDARVLERPVIVVSS